MDHNPLPDSTARFAKLSKSQFTQEFQFLGVSHWLGQDPTPRCSCPSIVAGNPKAAKGIPFQIVCNTASSLLPSSW